MQQPIPCKTVLGAKKALDNIVMVTPVITLIPIMDLFDVYKVYNTPEHRT